MARTVSLDLLNSIRIASPCTADWEQMSGDDRSRYCSACKLNVYNISNMTGDAAAALIEREQGHLCVRLFRRADGTVLTQDCPVGLRLIRKQVVRTAARIAAAAVMLVTGGMALATGTREGRVPRLRSMQPFVMIRGWLSPLSPPPPVPMMGDIAMGAVCPPPAPPAPIAKGGTP
jgi:hypothetical protein